MKSALLAVVAWVKSLFASETAGIIWQTILSNVKSKVVSLLTDKDLQTYAWNLVVELHKDETKTSAKKAAEFNKKMSEYIKEKGLVSSKSLVNALRELAYQAVSVKVEKQEVVQAQA